MLDAWTGEIVGKMHVHRITYDDMAAELGCGKAYVCMILNGRRNPIDAEQRLRDALERIIKRKERIA